MTVSSSEALPPRSPRPFIVTCAWSTPASIAASVFATARPRSLWQCTEKATRWNELSAARTARTSAANSCGCEYPTVSGMFIVRGPAALACDARDGLGLADRRRRETGLEDVDAEVGESLRDEELRLRRERRAGRLLAVAERGVEDGDLSHLAAPTGSRGFAGADCCGTSRRGSHGIISRSLRPTCSIGRRCSLARCA